MLNKGNRPHIQQDACCNDSAYFCGHTRKELHCILSGIKAISKKAKDNILDYLYKYFSLFEQEL